MSKVGKLNNLSSNISGSSLVYEFQNFGLEALQIDNFQIIS